MPQSLRPEVIAKLRRQALTEAPTLLLRNPSFRDAPALGVLMETGYPQSVVTVVSLIDGGASIYFSSGGGVIGGEGHEPVRLAARRFTQFAGLHLPEMSRCSDFPLPGIGLTIFYVLTQGGVFTQSVSEQELGGGTHSFSPLFYTGQCVITQLRMVSEKRK
jgi:hypothetical protein